MTDSPFTCCTLDDVLARASGKILVITPLYPSADNPYACAFVHTRVLAYRRAGLLVDVAVRAFDGITGCYQYEGVTVYKLSMNDLQALLRTRHYECIAVHFIENEYARVLESCDLSASNLFIWCHGAESLYWDRPKFTTPYFSEPRVMEAPELADLRRRDKLLERLNNRPNVTFVFVSEFAHQRSIELTGIHWNKWVVIPNPIDFEIYACQKKSPDQRTKVFCAKTHDDYSCYAMDTVVRTIVALSRRPCFDELSFTIVGNGSVHEKLVAPLRAFPNVNIVERFLNRQELVEQYQKHGVALFPTRYDTQGVSMCEAAAAGLAVVSTDRASVAAFLADNVGLLAPQDDYMAYANIVERLCADPDYFERCCTASYEKISQSCSPAITIEREIQLFQDQATPINDLLDEDKPTNPLLSVGILGATEADLAAFGYASVAWAHNRLEAIAIKSPAEIVDKAQGAYVKVLDSGGFVDPESLPQLMERLSECVSDVVLSDIWELAPHTEAPQIQGGFSFMVSGQTYEHEDLLPETYGFGANFPNSTFALFKRSWLESMRQSFENDEAFDDTYASLVESARTLSYLPLPAWHIRLAEPNPEPKNDGIDDGPNDVDNSVESDKPVHHRLRGLKSRLSRLVATKRTKS